MLLKKRKAKVWSRGIFLQDKVLKETVFQPGSHYKYVIDQKSKKVIILSSNDERDNTVSRRKLKETPVIDVKNKEALSVFEGCDYLQVEIFGERVVVQGYSATQSTAFQKVTQAASQVLSKKRKVVDISDFISVKKTAEVVMSRKSLQKAAGLLGYEQMELDLFFGESSGVSETSKSYLYPALANLEIPLVVSSLFSGCGLMDTGFILEGFDVVFALELNADAVETYQYNIGSDIIQGDITTFDKRKIAKS